MSAMSMEKDSTWKLNSLKKVTKETLVLPWWLMFGGLFKEILTKIFGGNEDAFYSFNQACFEF